MTLSSAVVIGRAPMGWGFSSVASAAKPQYHADILLLKLSKSQNQKSITVLALINFISHFITVKHNSPTIWN